MDITQTLGGTYTVHTMGGLFRISSKDADALQIEHPDTLAQAWVAEESDAPYDRKKAWDLFLKMSDHATWMVPSLISLQTVPEVSTSSEVSATAPASAPDGRPSLVVFSTPSCTVCRTAQYPAVESVEATYGSALRVLWVDLSRQPAVAAIFRVVTAPSTALLAADGRVRSFNHGFAPAEQLSAQLSALGAWPVSPR